MPPMPGLESEIVWLADLITRQYAREGIPIERVDCGSGRVLSDRFILDELGDFLQNVAALTPLLGRPEGMDWALRLVAHTRAARFRRGGLFETFAFHRRRWRRARGLGLAYPYWNLDTLTGLVGLYEILRTLSRRDEAAWLDREIAGFIRALLDGGIRAGRLRYGFHALTGVTLPLTSPQLTGYVAEELIRYGRLSGARRWIEAAAGLLRAECRGPWFSKHAVFCAEIHGPVAPLLRPVLHRLGKRHFFEPLLMKDNTLPAFALLALAGASPADADWALDTVGRWRSAVDARFLLAGGFFSAYARPFDRNPAVVRLTFNHPMIEWDIEAFVGTGDSARLERAQAMARSWLTLQTERGLFPEGPEEPWSSRSLLDSQVDLSVNLLKLGELTGVRRWTDAARANFAAIRRDFRLPAGYAWAVDCRAGRVLEPAIEVKYLGLLLKGYLGLWALATGRRLRDSPLIWMLLRDR